jgi:tetratricopeptide (TPR) repeat protein
MSSGPDYERRVASHLAELQEVLKIPRARYGKAIGVGEGQVSKRFKGTVTCSLNDVLKILGVMEVDPKEFFAGVTGEFHAELYLARLERKFAGQVKYGKYDLLRQSPSKHYEAVELLEAAEGLQELRLVSAEAAKAQALDILRTDYHYRPSGDPRTQVLARVSLAAIFRCEGYYGRTAFFLRTALRLAGSDGSLRGQVLQSVMSLASHQGDFQEAMAAVKTALSEYCQACDFRGQGRAMVSLGILHTTLRDFGRSTSAYNQALSLLPDDEWYGRFFVFQGLGMASIWRKQPQEALDYLQLALREIESKDVPFVRSWALWLRGEIHFDHAPERALEDFLVVQETFQASKLDPVVLALVSLRIAKAYLLLGRIGELRKLVEEAYCILTSIRKTNKVLAGTFREFLNLGLREELTVEILEYLYKKMHEGAPEAPPSLSAIQEQG